MKHLTQLLDTKNYPMTVGTHKELENIARQHGVPSLEAQGLDDLDFHDLHVAGIKAMLEAAWQLGRGA